MTAWPSVSDIPLRDYPRDRLRRAARRRWIDEADRPRGIVFVTDELVAVEEY
jgi:hypothetical protein